jgi:SAM-dependent methyltransferase
MANRELQAYYARDEERDRLAHGVGRVEYVRTVEILRRTLPPEGAVVADIGGGPGRYTDWLVDAGYQVVHRDLVAHHVDQVRRRHGVRVDSAVGDARTLDLAADSVDAVLLLGPLYHLDREADRLQALREARRVVRSDGIVHAAAISRWAPRLHGMLVDRVQNKYPVLTEVIDEMERTGTMPPLYESSFTGYAHTPDGLRDEIRQSKLTLESLVALEGIAFALSDLDDRMDDPTERTLLLGVLRAVEDVPDLVGLGPHLLATARVP